jgi:glycosyltransferase involved in cell wall biosynthesis
VTPIEPTSRAAAAPRVSVVIPTFNRARDVGRCLEALTRQTFRDFEVLVCDDGSKDNTREIVEGFTGRLDLQYHWAENFGGPARPRNAGLSLARGEYVAFLDSDDWWMPRKLEVSLRYLDDGADIVYHDLYVSKRADQKRSWLKSPTRALRKPVFEDLMIHGNGINNSSVTVRRSVMRAAGGFSEDRELIAAEDYDAWLRVARVTDRFVRIPEVLGYYWIGEGNISNPRRTLINLEALERIYAREIRAISERHSVYWLAYLKARCHYLMGAYDMAKRDLEVVRRQHAPFLVQAKRLWMKTFMRFSTGRQRA